MQGWRLGCQVIARAQRLASPKVGAARPVLLHEHIHTVGDHRGDQEAVTVQSVGEHHISRRERGLQMMKQRQLATAFARANRRFKNGACGQANHRHPIGRWETDALGLRAGLGEAGLVGHRVGHRRVRITRWNERNKTQNRDRAAQISCRDQRLRLVLVDIVHTVCCQRRPTR